MGTFYYSSENGSVYCSVHYSERKYNTEVLLQHVECLARGLPSCRVTRSVEENNVKNALLHGPHSPQPRRLSYCFDLVCGGLRPIRPVACGSETLCVCTTTPWSAWRGLAA